MRPNNHLVLLSIFLMVLIIGMLFHRESFTIINDISTNLMTPAYYESIIHDNQKKYFEPCDVATTDGVNFRFQASDSMLSWYAAKETPNSCSVDISSDEIDTNAQSCTTENKLVYDPTVVQDIHWDDNMKSGKRCVVVFRKDVSSSKLEEYLQKLPSYKKVLSNDGSYISVFNQSIQLFYTGVQKKVDIPNGFHNRFFKQPADDMSRTVCFWCKLWWLSDEWRLLGSVGHGEWWERKPAIYLAGGWDSWLHFTINNTDDSWQDYVNSSMKLDYDNCFVSCRIYKANDGKYKMTIKMTKLSQDGQEQVEQQTIQITGKPKLSDITEIGNRYMMFGGGTGNDGGGGFSMWDWRVYNKFVTDSELNDIKDKGKTKICYKSMGNSRVPQYFLLNTHMNKDVVSDLIIHPEKTTWNSLGNEYFTQQIEKGNIKYLCVPYERDRIYKITKITKNVHNYWTFITLSDIDVKGNSTNRSISANMLYNPNNNNKSQQSFQKIVIGLKELPNDFTNGTWLSEIYPSDVPQ